MPIESPLLDDLRYDRIVEESIRRIPVFTPEWTNFNDSDPGVTMIQLIALVAEQVGYRLNLVPEKNHIELLKLLGVRLQPARAARTMLAYLLSNPAALAPFVLQQGSRAKAKKGEPPPSFETEKDIDIVPAQPVVLVTTKNQKLWNLRLRDNGTLDLITGDPPESPSPASPWHAVSWDGRKPKLKDMPVDPVVIFPDATQKYLWIGLDYNPAPDAGFLGVRVTLTVQLDDDELPDLSGVSACSASVMGESASPTVDWLHYYDAGAGELRPIVRRIDDSTNRLARSGSIRFFVPSSMGPIPAADFVDIVEAVVAGPQETCVSLATAMRAHLGALNPGGALGTVEVDIAELQTALTAAIGDAEGLATVPVAPVAHPLDPALRDPAKVKGWLRITMPSAPNPSPKLRIAVFNAVEAVNSTTVNSELLGTSNGRPGQTFRLANGNVLRGTLRLAIQESPADPILTWTEVDSLDGAGPFDRVFSLDAEAGIILFGDGRRGRIPPLVPRGGAVVALTYRWGGGKNGEVAAGQITILESSPAGVEAVTNPVAARGGADAEVLEAAKIRARKELSTRSRAVTATDFEWIALQTPTVRAARVHIVPLRKPLACIDARIGEPCGEGGAPDATAAMRDGSGKGSPSGDSKTTKGSPCAPPCGSSGTRGGGSTGTMSDPTKSFGTGALITPRCGDPLPAGPLGLDDGVIAHGAVSVVVVPDEEGPEPLPTRSMLRAVCEQLNKHRLITTEIFVVPPQYVRLCNFEIEVRAKPGYTRTAVQDLVEAKLGRYLHVLTGGEDGKGFPFGAQLHIADLIAQVFRTEGVERVESLTCEFTRTKSNADPREGRLVLCQSAPDEREKLDLAPEENVSVDLTRFTLSTV